MFFDVAPELLFARLVSATDEMWGLADTYVHAE